jgi:hypothetical protein
VENIKLIEFPDFPNLISNLDRVQKVDVMKHKQFSGLGLGW